MVTRRNSVILHGMNLYTAHNPAVMATTRTRPQIMAWGLSTFVKQNSTTKSVIAA